jgi:hypothetical protein
MTRETEAEVDDLTAKYDRLLSMQLETQAAPCFPASTAAPTREPGTVLNPRQAKKKASKEPYKYYAVAKGRKPGIYTVWRDAQKEVNGFSGSRFKGFKVRDDAEEWMAENLGKAESSGNETPQLLDTTDHSSNKSSNSSIETSGFSRRRQ